VGNLPGDGEDVRLAEGVGAGPLEVSLLAVDQPVEDAIGVGGEGVAAFPDEQTAGADLHRHGHAVEADGSALDEHFTTRFTRPGVAPSGVIDSCGLPAVYDLGERETEGHVGQRVPVV